MSVMLEASKCRRFGEFALRARDVEVAERGELRRREIEGRGQGGDVVLHGVHHAHEVAQHVARERLALDFRPPASGHVDSCATVNGWANQ